MTRQVAFLRGINVGRNRRVGMGDLRAALGDAGYADVRTHLQSGNVVLASDLRGEKLERQLERDLAKRLGVELKVLVRSRTELAKIVARDPFSKVADNPSRYLVTFLAKKLAPTKVKALAALAQESERFAAHGRELYAWHPDGASNSALWKALADPRLGVTATARNWNTVTKLLALLDE